MQHGIVQEATTMRPIMQFFSARLSALGLRIWAQQSLGASHFAAMLPRSTPEVGAIGPAFMGFARLGGAA